MTEELIQLPSVAEIKEMLDIASRDIKTEVEQDPESQPASELVLQVINVIEGKLAKSKDFTKLNQTEKIDIAAHLNFLQSLLEDFFMFGEDFDEDFDEDEFEDEEYEDAEIDDEK